MAALLVWGAKTVSALLLQVAHVDVLSLASLSEPLEEMSQHSFKDVLSKHRTKGRKEEPAWLTE